jgi:hypothetical protein
MQRQALAHSHRDHRGLRPLLLEIPMKFFLVKVGNVMYRDLQPSSCDAVIAAISRFPGARRVVVKVMP